MATRMLLLIAALCTFGCEEPDPCTEPDLRMAAWLMLNTDCDIWSCYDGECQCNDETSDGYNNAPEGAILGWRRKE